MNSTLLCNHFCGGVLSSIRLPVRSADVVESAAPCLVTSVCRGLTGASLASTCLSFKWISCAGQGHKSRIFMECGVCSGKGA